jgi:hypothetical protein
MCMCVCMCMYVCVYIYIYITVFLRLFGNENEVTVYKIVDLRLMSSGTVIIPDVSEERIVLFFDDNRDMKQFQYSV